MATETTLDDLKDVSLKAEYFGYLIAAPINETQSLARMGIIPKGHTRTQYLLVEGVRGWAKMIREELRDAEKRVTDAANADKGRLMRAKAEMAELEMRERLGELVDIAGLEKILADALTTFRQRLIAIPTRCAPLVTTETPEGAARIMRELIEQACTELAASFAEQPRKSLRANQPSVGFDSATA